MLPIEVDSGSYVDAVAELAGADRAIVDLVSTLTGTLSGCGAMAGSDTGGEEWAAQYDPAAAQLVDAGCKLADALASMANLLNGSLANHQGGNYGALIYPGEPEQAGGDTMPAHSTASLSTSAPLGRRRHRRSALVVALDRRPCRRAAVARRRHREAALGRVRLAQGRRVAESAAVLPRCGRGCPVRDQLAGDG